MIIRVDIRITRPEASRASIDSTEPSSVEGEYVIGVTLSSYSLLARDILAVSVNIGGVFRARHNRGTDGTTDLLPVG